SANHNQNFEEARKLIAIAKDAGADAVKLQTYTADTLTIDCREAPFMIEGTIWEGKNPHDLYKEAYTPWEWHEPLMKEAQALGLHCFSSPFDFTAVDLLESLNVPAYKIASFELVDLPLIRRCAETGKPMIMSTGMATLEEIEEAVQTARDGGCKELALLKCNSGYPAPPEEMNLRTIPDMQERFGVPIGLSDHTLGIEIPVAAVALGACVIEKHFTSSRDVPGPDSAFSLEPHEFKAMVEAVRHAQAALGEVRYRPTDKEMASRTYRRSLFVVEDVRAGEPFTQANVRSIRPGHGMHTRYLPQILTKRAKVDIKRGTPLNPDLID
ncbi:MAG TPA: pseudaminic acid synthase, partial [Fimbriimonadaceae bacterium]|nr:pseudaminic acid synthase [Fimbriimonadaceae bacterium]